MTQNTVITATEALKNKAKFEEFIANSDKSQFEEILKDYPENPERIYISDLTQKYESYINKINESEAKTPYIIWIVTNTKPELLKAVSLFNRTRNKNVGIFVFKASLNEDQIRFECILKPQKTAKNKNSGKETEKFNLDFWTKYQEICNKYDMNMQVKPQPKRWQMIGIGKSGVQIMQTVSRKSQYIASELYISCLLYTSPSPRDS